MPLIKIWNFDRSIKKLAFADNINQLKEISKTKFNYTETNLKIVFEQDGTEIDNDDEFQCLLQDPSFSQTVLQVLPEHQSWMPASTDIQNLALFRDLEHPIAASTIIAEPSTSASNFNTSTKHIYETEDSLYNFTIPTEKFPQRFLNDCAEQKKPDAADRREVVRQIIAAVREKNKNPPRKFLESIANDMILNYPSLSDAVGSKKYLSFFTQLENRLHHCNRLGKHDEKKIKFSEGRNTPILKKNRATHGCSQWQPLEYPEGENITSQNEKKRMVKGPA